MLLEAVSLRQAPQILQEVSLVHPRKADFKMNILSVLVV